MDIPKKSHMLNNNIASKEPEGTASALVNRSVIELDVGGTHYTTLRETLLGHNLKSNVQERSLFHELLGSGSTDADEPALSSSAHLSNGGSFVFLDRDGPSFRYILGYLRTGQLLLPTAYDGIAMLRGEAEYYRLPSLVQALDARRKSAVIGFNASLIPGDVQNEETLDASALSVSTVSLSASDVGEGVGSGLPRVAGVSAAGYVTVAYRGTFAFGRDGQADVKFRKMSRILVCGRVNLCREIFGDTLNESRDPDRGHYERYSSRFFLKHNFLEQAFDDLQRAGFRCTGCCGTSTSSSCKIDLNEENKWNHYNEFVFCRP